MRWLDSDFDGRCEEGSSELFQNYDDLKCSNYELRMFIRTTSLREHERLTKSIELQQSQIIYNGKRATKGSPRHHALRAMWKIREAAKCWISENPDASHNPLDFAQDENNLANYYHWDPDVEEIESKIHLTPRHNISNISAVDSIKRAQPIVNSLKTGGFTNRYWLYRAIEKANLDKVERNAIWKLWNKVHGQKKESSYNDK